MVKISFGKMSLSLILVLIVLQIFVSLIPILQDSGDSFGDAQQCSSASCFYNTTASADDPCRDSTNHSMVCSSGQPTIPLNTLFSSTGVAILIVMVALFFLIIRGFLSKGSK